MSDSVPQDIKASDFACEAPGLKERYVLPSSIMDFSGLAPMLRPNHECYPVWVCPDLTLYLENWEHPPLPTANTSSTDTSSARTANHAASCDHQGGGGASSSSSLSTGRPLLKGAHELVAEELLAIAEPKSRPDLLHTYALTNEALHGAAYGHDMRPQDVLAILERHSKVWPLPSSVVAFVETCGARHCRAKLALVASRHYVVSEESVLRALLRQPSIARARLMDEFAQKDVFEAVETVEDESRRDRNNPKLKDLASGLSANGSASAERRERRVAPGSWSSRCPLSDSGPAKPSSPILRLEAMDALSESEDEDEDEQGGEGLGKGAGAGGWLKRPRPPAVASSTAATAAAVLGSGADANPPKRLKLVFPTRAAGVGRLSDGPKSKLSLRFAVRPDRGYMEDVRAEAWRRGYPLLEEYDFERDSRNLPILVSVARGENRQGGAIQRQEKRPYGLRPRVQVRDYQHKALLGMFGDGRKARSGIIVLPCGAGKTLVGICAAVRVGRSCVVLCNNNAAVEQWRRSFQMFTDIPEQRLLVFHSKDKPEKLPDPCVLITTYHILAERRKPGSQAPVGAQALATQHVLDLIKGKEGAPREWALMVLDEVHMAPATTFRSVMEVCKCQCKLGLTATLVREDEKIEDLGYLIGPKLHEANWTDLANQGFLATVTCCEVWCSMAAASMSELLFREHKPHAWEQGGQKKLAIMNPNKLRAAEFLLRRHGARRDKILLFSDDIHSLKTYCEVLKIPNLWGATTHGEREALLGCFRGDDEHVFKNFVRLERRRRRWLDKKSGQPYEWGDVVNGVDLGDEENRRLFDEFNKLPDEERAKFQFGSLGLSKVGDVAIDLPDANILIQVSGHGGGRRQEAQRMGRILRPKSGTGPGSNEAIFYSLVSRDTHEMVTGTKRQEYLVDQGYTYKVLLAEDLMRAHRNLPPGSPEPAFQAARAKAGGGGGLGEELVVYESAVPLGSTAEHDLLAGTLGAIAGPSNNGGGAGRGGGAGQEAQRMGRILRPKSGTGPGSNEAIFYSLVGE
eukprot:CAMPEP_0172644402 /NCGR_PEP_ID=MMETSP1068-20121228/239190_1 /TAXON_ID=35684 /ORGANISM="Pseudopedinella elastica, Strain CCMP716" /LENGTH=1026 /DNA_ID=CAMNT_0013458601 /DNA_START=179 /DNA_END=3259 /DNA_ORIENTATION=+